VEPVAHSLPPGRKDASGPDPLRTKDESPDSATRSTTVAPPEPVTDAVLSGRVPDPVFTRTVVLDSSDGSLGADEIVRVGALAADVAREVMRRAETGQPLPEVTYTVDRTASVAGQPHFGKSFRDSAAWAERIRTVFDRSLEAHLPNLASRLKARTVLGSPGTALSAHSDAVGAAGPGRAVIAVHEARLPEEFPGWVNRYLGQIGADAISPDRVEQVIRAVRELELSQGGAFTRMDVKARAEAVARHIAGVRFGGVKGGTSPQLPGKTGRNIGAEEGTSGSGKASGSRGPHAVRGTLHPVLLGELLDQRRPPEIDREMPLPPQVTGPLRFSDGARLPAYMTGEPIEGLEQWTGPRAFALGTGQHETRGVDLVAGELGDWLGRSAGVRPAHPEALLDLVGRSLRGDLREFVGEVKTFDYKSVRRERLRLEMTTALYDDVERYTFGPANPVKNDTMQRFTATRGKVKVNGSSWGLAPTVPLGLNSLATSGWGRAFVQTVFSKQVRFNLQDQVTNQTENRSTDASHVHLGSVRYEFRVVDRFGRPVGVDGRVIAEGRTDQDRARLGFAVRDGFTARLAASLTSAAPEADAGFPRRIVANGQLRGAVVEGVGSVRHVRDGVLERAGVSAGTRGAEQITDFFSVPNFQAIMRSLYMGPVMTPILHGGRAGTDPLGVLKVRVEPVELHLINETKAAEMRDISTSTVRNEQMMGNSRHTGIGGSAGPGFNVSHLPTGFNLRVLAGLTFRYGAGRRLERVEGGGVDAVKTGAQAKGSATGLYLVRQRVHVTGPLLEPRPRNPGKLQKAHVAGPLLEPGPRNPRNNPPRPRSEQADHEGYETWSVVRLAHSEALRLAGEEWLTRTGADGQVPVPLPVTRETLALSRVQEITFGDGSASRLVDGRSVSYSEYFSGAVSRAIRDVHPDLVAPMEEMYRQNPRWRNTDHFETVLRNTLEVHHALSYQSMAANLGVMMDGGLRIDLVESNRFTRGHRQVWIHAELGEPRYQGLQKDLRIRFSAPGSENMSGQQSSSRSWQIGLEGSVSIRDKSPGVAGNPLEAGTASVGLRYGRRAESESGYGRSVGSEVASIGTGGSHTFEYDLTFRVAFDGWTRPRGWVRGLTLQALGTQPFVHVEREVTLIGPGAAGAEEGAAPSRGRVVLSVPVGLTRRAPADPDLAAAADRVAEPQVEVMAAADARDMALGTARWLESAIGPADAAARLAASILEHPHATVAVLGGRQLAGMMLEVLHEASRGSWLVTQPGTPGYEAALRSLQYQSRTANFDRNAGPLGSHMRLVTKAPYLDRETRLRYEIRLRPGLTVVSPVLKMEVEDAVGGTTQISGRNTRTSSWTFGGQLNYMRSVDVGTGVVSTQGLALIPFRLDRVASESVQRSAVAEINRKNVGGHQFVVAASVEHRLAVDSSRVGAGAYDSPLVPRSLAGVAGRTMRVEDGAYFAIDEKSKIELGIEDGYGTVPRYDTEVQWEPFPWQRQRPFGSWPATSLNPARALHEFEAHLRRLGLPDADLEHLRRLVSGRALRALSNDLVGKGVSTPARIGRWGSEHLQLWVGSRQARLRVELVPTSEVRFAGLDHSVELEEHRHATETVQNSRSRSLGATVGITVSEGANTGHGTVRTVGPTLSQSGTSMAFTSTTDTESTVFGSTVTNTEMHAVYETRYELRLELEITDAGPIQQGAAGADATGPQGPRDEWWRTWTGRRKHTVSVQQGAGFLRQHYPLSLMRVRPDSSVAAGDPLEPRRLELRPDQSRRVAQLPRLGAGGWHDVRHADGTDRPFAMPEEGFAVRGIFGLEALHKANVLVLAAAQDLSLVLPDGHEADEALLARAADTPLTRAGTGPAQSLTDGTTDTALTAFYQQTLTPDGYQVAGLTDRGFFGGVDGSLTLYSKPDFSGARLLTVADGVKFETPKRNAHSSVSTFAHVDSSDRVLDVGPTIRSEAGTHQLGSAPMEQETDSVTSSLSYDRLNSVNIKPDNSQRTFLFAVPMRWLSVAQAHHHVQDSAAMTVYHSVFGNARRVPQAMETDTVALVWAREDVARRLGLLTEANHPEPVREAWNAVKRASAALTTADKAYWDLRRGEGAERQTALVEAGARVTALEQRAVDTVPAVRDAQGALDALLRERAEDDAEAAHDEWEELRSERIAQARETLEQARRAAADEVTAARVAADAAQARVDEVTTDLEALRQHAGALATELGRVRQGADRLSSWYQLSPADRASRQSEGAGEPDDVTFTPPKGPTTTITKASAPKKAPAAPAVRQDVPPTDAKPAHATAPWERQGGPVEEGLSFDAATDHRTLTMTDAEGQNHVLDLYRPEVDENGIPGRPTTDEGRVVPRRMVAGNGFWAAVALAAGNRAEELGDLARRVSGSNFPEEMRIDPRAVFRIEELERVFPDDLRGNPELREQILGDGGRLPQNLREALTPQQNRALLTTHLTTARRWDAATAHEAASMAARIGHIDLIVVGEDGSHRQYSHGEADASGTRSLVIVYRRGAVYLAALPRHSGGSVVGPSDSEPRELIGKGKRPQRDERTPGSLSEMVEAARRENPSFQHHSRNELVAEVLHRRKAEHPSPQP
jgi:hypothetical protein